MDTMVWVPRSVGSTMLNEYALVEMSPSADGSVKVDVFRMCSFSATITASFACSTPEQRPPPSTRQHAELGPETTRVPAHGTATHHNLVQQLLELRFVLGRKLWPHGLLGRRPRQLLLQPLHLCRQVVDGVPGAHSTTEQVRRTVDVCQGNTGL